MADKKITGWFTMNGKHIPIFEGESQKDATNRAIAKANEDKKNKDIARNQASALHTKEIYEKATSAYPKLRQQDKELKALKDEIDQARADGKDVTELMEKYKKLDAAYKKDFEEYAKLSSEFNKRPDKDNYLKGAVKKDKFMSTGYLDKLLKYINSDSYIQKLGKYVSRNSNISPEEVLKTNGLYKNLDSYADKNGLNREEVRRAFLRGANELWNKNKKK